MRSGGSVESIRSGGLHAVPGRGPSPTGAPGSISLVLADDHAFVRRCLRALLDGEAELDVVAEASDAASVLREIRVHQPHVLVLDRGMLGKPSLAAIRRLRSQAPSTEIVVTSMVGDPRLASEAIAAGASAYVAKASADEDLPEAIRCVARGESFAALPPRPLGEKAGGALSEHELELVRLIVLGQTNAEIAQELKTSIPAVEARRARIHGKLGLSTRAEFARYALRRGLLVTPASRDGAS